jgi:hypothetical protein
MSSDDVEKCATGGSDIKINYKLDLHLKVLGISVKPTFSDSASFECPISSSQIEVSYVPRINGEADRVGYHWRAIGFIAWRVQFQLQRQCMRWTMYHMRS